jgi:hypothetical protein
VASPAAPAGCATSWKLLDTPDRARGFKITSLSALSRKSVWLTGWIPLDSTGSVVLRSDGRVVEAPAQVPAAPFLGVWTEESSFSSDTEGWALARASLHPAGSRFAEHWHDGRWTMTPLAVSPDPEHVHLSLGSVASVSPTDAWAVGATADSPVATHLLGALVEHWDGQAWSAVPNPADHREHAGLRGISVTSPTDIWAVGLQRPDGQVALPLVLHWDGTAWTEVPAPDGNGLSALNAVSAVDGDDVWAAGSQLMPGTTNLATPLVEHWDGSAWSVVTSLPDLGNARIDRVYAASADSVWMILERPEGTSFLHWDGATWTEQAPPGGQGLGYYYVYNDIGGTGPHDVWAAGELVQLNAETVTPQVAHLSCGQS